MQQEIKNPAVRPGFEGRCGVGNPQQNHEILSQNCQESYGPINLLADLLERYLELRNELALLRAENARLRVIAGGCV